jgi:Multiubiquitin
MTENATVAAEEAAKHEQFVVIVNGQPHPVESQIVSYEEIVKIAYPTPPSPDTRYTVTYRNAKEPKEGSLAPGQSVEVKKGGTIFNVKATGRS